MYRAHVRDVSNLVRYGFTTETVRVWGERDADAQRDLIQEVFLRAFSRQARERYDGLRPYRPYLLRIAKNLLVDKLRQRPVDAPDEAPDPEWEAQVAETESYVKTLDVKAQQLVELRYVQANSQESTAASLGLSRKQVRTAEKKVLDGLKQWLMRAKNDGAP